MIATCICRPATPERLGDARAVLGDCGNASKCCCAYFYRSNAEFKAGWGEGNRRYFGRLIRRRPPPGVIAYVEDSPAGWCSVGPRIRFDRLNRSKHFAPVDEVTVWSITCFVVVKRFRRRGLLSQLLAGAVTYAQSRDAGMIEAYPVDRPGRSGSGDLYPGPLSVFLDAGFSEVARRLPTRPIVRKGLPKPVPG